jgi:hypothetical protein
MYIKFRRISEMKVPFDVFAEANNDWTHFTHLHRKSHAEFRLLYKSGRRQIFLYKTRLFPPLPFCESFIVMREEMPEQAGYRNVYLHVRTGRVNYLDGSTVQGKETVEGIGEFWFEVGWPWTWLPGVFAALFRRRMRQVLEEDNVLMRERIKLGAFSSERCAPPQPKEYDFYVDMMKDGFPKPARSYEDRKLDDLMPKDGGKP